MKTRLNFSAQVYMPARCKMDPHGRKGMISDEQQSALNEYMITLKPYVDQYGYWAVFGAILLESFGVPTPGEGTLMVGSFLASQGDLSISSVVIAAWMAAVVGDNIGYAIGRKGGRPLILRYGRYIFITQARLEFTESFFRKHGGIIVIAARFFAVLRQLNGMVAGIAGMSWRNFLFYNALGAAFWVGFWSSAFYFLGTEVLRYGVTYKKLTIIVLILLGMTILIVSAYRRWLRKS
jgi:membrane protein DedA with SNARE-associated domain